MSGSDLDPVARRTGRLTRIVSGLGVVIPLPLTLLSQMLSRQEPTFESLLPALLATGLCLAVAVWSWRPKAEPPIFLSHLVVGAFWTLGLLSALDGDLEVAWLALVALFAIPILGLWVGGMWSLLALVVAAGGAQFAGLAAVDSMGDSTAVPVLLVVIGMTWTFVASGLRTDRDIRKVIETRKRSEQEARAANRAKSDFLANVSHEIRTPMNGVVGMADLLMRSDLEPADRQKVEVINASAETLLALVDEILDLSKIEAGKLSLYPVDFTLRDLVSKVALLLRPQVSAKGLELIVDVDADIPDRLHGDPVRLRQILLNLMGNAVKFTHQGHVALRITREEPRQGTVALYVAVSDTGIGIGDRARAQLFTPFGQADSSSTRNFSGTGLGLVISKRLVELMGGTIDFDSRRGMGSTFWFRVALEPAHQLASDPSGVALSAEDIKPLGEACCVLVVEDNPVNRLIAEKHLEVLGYDVIGVEGGAQALEEFAARDFDAVLMDCQMPGMDGYETTRRLRKLEESARRKTPIIAVTAHAMEGERERCAAAGMDDYLAKPFRSEELAGILERWLGAPGDRSSGSIPQPSTQAMRRAREALNDDGETP